MKLSDVVREYLETRGPGQHRLIDGFAWVSERCAELGITATDDEIKREFRDVAGYP